MARNLPIHGRLLGLTAGRFRKLRRRETIEDAVKARVVVFPKFGYVRSPLARALQKVLGTAVPYCAYGLARVDGL
jgi:hypothetical protein